MEPMTAAEKKQQDLMDMLDFLGSERRRCEAKIESTIREARSGDELHEVWLSWGDIAMALGVSRQAVWERYAR